MASIPPVAQLSVGLVDHLGRISRVKVHTAPVLDDGSNWGALFHDTPSVFVSMHAALAGLSTCNFINWSEEEVLEANDPSVPSSLYADAGTVMRFYTVDGVTGYKSHVDIPGPAAAAIPSGTTEVDQAQALVAAMIVALGTTKTNQGNNFTVYDVRIVDKRRRNARRGGT